MSTLHIAHRKDSSGVDFWLRMGIALAVVSLLLPFLHYTGIQPTLMINLVSLFGIITGVAIFSWRSFMLSPPGIKNNYVVFRQLSSRGVIAWVLSVVLTLFYIYLYWYPEHLGLGTDGAPNSGLVGFFDPLSLWIKGVPSSQWFVYGLLYTVFILAMGVRFIMKYRHNRYQIIRTISVMFFQLGFAFIIPEIMESLRQGQPYLDGDLKNIWPLNYDFFHSWHLNNMKSSGAWGMLILITGIAMFAVVTPVLTYFYGKRWYCSWVCGCGGLAETAGDSFRHLSSSKLAAWKIERWMVYSVLLIVTFMTVATLYGYFTQSATFLGLDIYSYYQRPYGFIIGAMFSGVIGVGFYPILGTRVWCRFGCPMAAYLGILQKYFSKFQITTNGGQCISCGNCSRYCEMGIDVRAYAQKKENVIRASCVGCGICSAVCPRGVLKLENTRKL
ncbi:MAG: hypothetical protein RL220_860 [Bacteroidota bacterium]